MVDTLSCLAAVKTNGKLWCSNLNFNGLYTVDLENNHVEFIGRFLHYDTLSVGLHRFACSYNDKVFFFPQYSCSIDSYNMDGEFCICELESWKRRAGTKFIPKTAGVFEWDGKFYVFPRYPGMNLLVYDPMKNAIVEEIELKVANALFSNNAITMVYDCIQLDGIVYIPILGTNHIVKYDINHREECEVDLPNSQNICGAIGYYNNGFMINCDKKIKQFDFEFNNILRSYDCLKENENRITDFIVLKSKIVAIPDFLGALKVIDLTTNIVEEYSLDLNDRRLKSGTISRWHHVERSISHKNETILLPIGLNRGIKFDNSLNSIEDFCCILPKDSLPDIRFDSINHEDMNLGLEDFIRKLV